MSDNKTNRIRKAPALENNSKQQDQVLSGASGAPDVSIKAPKASAPKQKKTQNTQQKQQKSQRTANKNTTKSNNNKANQKKQNTNQTSQNKTGKTQGKNQANSKTNKNQAQSKTQTTKNTNKRQNNANTSTAKKTNTRATQARAGSVMSQMNGKKQAAKPKKQATKKNKKNSSVKVYFLGGLNEIGKNFTVYECNNELIIVDCGMAFPDEDMLGIDIVIPDFSFVEENKDRIKGIVITHGHEDHIGALPFLLRKVNAPIYGTPLTLGLIEGKLKEHNLAGVTTLKVTRAGETIKLGSFDVEFIHVNHSISDAVALAIHTPAGIVVHTGDFKIDCTPTEGEMIDLARFAELGNEGVLALLADSTNAERPGYTLTEQKVNDTLESLFYEAEGRRIIVATFASNISRVQQIINCAVKNGRKVALSGRSMLNVMGIASELGYLNIPDGTLIDLSMINRYLPEQIVLITTGSQGETMSALARMAMNDHRQVSVGPNDFIIISARPIPGNEKTVGVVVDELLKRGCRVVYESMYDVHVSGHACQEELKLIQSLVKPKFFVPVHGEQKHLRKNAKLAFDLGMSEKNVYIGDNGHVIEINENEIKHIGEVPAGSIMVDGLGVGDVGNIVLRDRKHLGEDGIIIVVCSIDEVTGDIISGPDIVSRGFVYVRESELLLEESRELAYKTLERSVRANHGDWNAIKLDIKETLSRFLYKETKRNPMVLPIIMEV